MLRRMLILAIVSTIGFSTARADDSDVTAQFAPPLKAAPPPFDNQETGHSGCSIDICGLKLPDELWKRDALRKEDENYMNEAAILIDRSRREALDERFAETPLLELKIGKACSISFPRLWDCKF